MSTKHTLVKNYEQLDELCDEIRQASTVALDLETEHFNHLKDRVVGVAVSTTVGDASYIPLVHPDPGLLPTVEVAERLKPLIQDEDKTYIFHNAKFDTRFFKNQLDIEIPPASVEDTLLEVFCAGELHESLGLKNLVQKLFKHDMVKFEDLFPKGTKDKNPGLLRADLVGPYACEDADYTLRLHQLYYDKVRTSNIYKLERRLWPVVQEIEDTGFLVDQEYLSQATAELNAALQRLELAIYAQVDAAMGYPVNFKISSTKDLSQVLYELLGLPVLVRTPKGAPATNKMALTKLKERGYTLAGMLLDHGSIQSLATNLGETLPSQTWDDGKIHTSYNQAGASTGRFGSSGPNTQNIAKTKKWQLTDAEGVKFTLEVSPRKAFLPDKGHYLVELDFGQIEFVCMAYLAGEEQVVEAYLRGLDIHQNTASLMYGIPYEEVTTKGSGNQRDLAKMFNYLIIYGGSAYGLSMRSDLTEEAAEQGMQRVMQAYPKFAKFMNDIKDQSKITKSVATYFGRKQMIPEFFDTNPRARSKAERVGVNRIVQGTAADIQKMGLIRGLRVRDEVFASGRIENFRQKDYVKMVAQTHDSQTWSIYMDIRPQDILPALMEAMSPPIPSFPRILVDAKIGLNWGDMVNYDEGREYRWDDLTEMVVTKKEEVRKAQINISLADVPEIERAKALMDLTSLAVMFEGDLLIVVLEDAGMGERTFTIGLTYEDFKSIVDTRVPRAKMTGR